MRRIIIKEGPLVFLRNVLLMEVIAAFFFFGLSFAGNYGAIYEHWGLATYIRFDIFEIFIFSVFQLIYISLLFLDWYVTHFEVRDREIVRRSGLLFRRNRSVRISDVVSVETYHSPLSRLMRRHATIILEHSNGRVTKIRNVADVDEQMFIIKDMIQEASGRSLADDPQVLIRRGESQYIEFKETLRYDAKKGETSKELERMVLKTIIAFLNADGGTLFIGVNDDGMSTGLDNDYKTLVKKNRDGFENHLTMLVKTQVGIAFVKYVKTRFEVVEGKDICVVTVRSSHKPAYLQGQNGDKREEFFVRVGNSSQPFSMSEAEEYIRNKWK